MVWYGMVCMLYDMNSDIREMRDVFPFHETISWKYNFMKISLYVEM